MYFLSIDVLEMLAVKCLNLAHDPWTILTMERDKQWDLPTVYTGTVAL